MLFHRTGRGLPNITKLAMYAESHVCTQLIQSQPSEALLHGALIPPDTATYMTHQSFSTKSVEFSHSGSRKAHQPSGPLRPPLTVSFITASRQHLSQSRGLEVTSLCKAPYQAPGLTASPKRLLSVPPPSGSRNGFSRGV